MAAAASDPSTPTPKVAAAGPGRRSDGTGIAWTKTAIPARSASQKNSRNRGSPSDTPPTLDAISTPASPRPATAESSAAARPGSCSGTVPSPYIRPGAAAHSEAMYSLTHRAKSRPAIKGSA
jgi:hypothetical protein